MKVVVCSEIQWGYVRTRKQQLLRRFPPAWRILFLQAYVRGKPNDWWPRREGNVTRMTIPVLKPAPQPGMRRVLGWAPVRAVWNAVLVLWVAIARLLTGFAGAGVVLVVSNIYYGRILRLMPRRAAVYDCNDDHLAFPGTPAWAHGYFERVVRAVDAVVVSSPVLRELVEPLGPRRVEEIGNGVDLDVFERARRDPAPVPDLEACPAPRVVYAGALAPWIDFELLDRVAAALPQGSLVLLGPPVGGADVEGFVAARDNVHWLGSKPHDLLPSYLMRTQVALIPFRKTRLTHGVNPNKLWEYFALGLPVVSTDFSPFLEAFRPHVDVADGPEAFVAAVRARLDDPGDAGVRRGVAAEHSWDRSAARFVELLESLAARRL